MNGRILYCAALTACFAGTTLWAQNGASVWPPSPDHLTMPIWPGSPPGANTNLPPEANVNADGTKQMAGRPYIRLGNVSTPTHHCLQADKRRTRARRLSCFPAAATRSSPSIWKAQKFATGSTQIGVNCVLVKYRVPDSGPYPKSPAALQDAQRAMGLVREHAAEWGIDPHRVGVLGFSAGAHLSAAVSTHYDKRLYDTDRRSRQIELQAGLRGGHLSRLPGTGRTELCAQSRHPSHGRYAADFHPAGRRRYRRTWRMRWCISWS